MASSQRYDVVVLGAGALDLHARGIKVAIVARDLPEDLHSTGFASPWAGANWASFASNPEEERRDTLTFKHFDVLSKSHPDLVRRTPFKYYAKRDLYGQQWFKDLVYDYRRLQPSEIPSPWTHGMAWSAYTINTPSYLAYLSSTLRELQVPFFRHRLSSLDEAYDLQVPSRGSGPGPVKLVINATALGSRSLLGVQDKTVRPARGQTVLVHAPNVTTNYGCRDSLPKGESMYVIPRPGPEGHVVLGGTFLLDDWDTQPDPVVAERILRNAYRLCPDLAGAKGTETKGSSGEAMKGTALEEEEGWKRIKVVSHNVGLRPVRDGGVRIELEERELGQAALNRPRPRAGQSGGSRGKGRVGVVHAYGIGPAGYQASIGVAKDAADLAEKYLNETKGARAPTKSKL